MMHHGCILKELEMLYFDKMLSAYQCLTWWRWLSELYSFLIIWQNSNRLSELGSIMIVISLQKSITITTVNVIEYNIL